MQFVGSHIISVDQFSRSAADQVFTVADQLRPYAQREKMTRVLEGAILSNMFFEPSTRTRVSFGSAFNLWAARFEKLPKSKLPRSPRANRFTTPQGF